MVVLALALLVPLAAASQGQITIPRYSHATVLTLTLHQTDTIDYSWTANSSVTFRIENATGANTFVSIAGQTGSGTWQSAANGNYTFDFRNFLNSVATVQWNITIQPALPATYIYLILAGVIGVVSITAFRFLGKKPTN